MKMPEAEVSLRLAIHLIENNLTISDVDVALQTPFTSQYQNFLRRLVGRRQRKMPSGRVNTGMRNMIAKSESTLVLDVVTL